MTSTHAPLTLRAPLDRSSAPCLRASLVPATRSAKPPPGAFVRLGGSQLTRVCRTSSHPCDRTVVRRTACPRATASRAEASANAVESRAGDSGPAEGAVEREYDAVVIGAGMGGLVAATQMAVRGMRVLLLEKYLIPGGSSGWYARDGYTFDVGSSVMFGFGDKGNVNLVTRALAAVGRKLPLLEDPVAVHYHMPNGLSVQVHRSYEQFLEELVARFPHERDGIRKFYDECWTVSTVVSLHLRNLQLVRFSPTPPPLPLLHRTTPNHPHKPLPTPPSGQVFNALNALELQSLEEPLYLLGQFFRNPRACLTLAYYLPQNAGDIARKYISDADLLAFIDAECFIVSTVNAANTPMINAAMVLCDRHYGGINYPRGGVGRIAQELVAGLVERGGEVRYQANVTQLLFDHHGRAAGVKLSDGRTVRAKTVVSNATRWDTFGKLVPLERMPEEERQFQQRYRQAPSFLSMHLGVKAHALPPGTECHHLVLESEWGRMEEPYESIFLSIPTVLDPSLAPAGRHILHVFTTAWMHDWQVGCTSGRWDARLAGGMHEWQVGCTSGRWDARVARGMHEWQVGCTTGRWDARLAGGMHDWQVGCMTGRWDA
ncbi:unnamed protein product [Closterium sp. NIES-54]